MMTQILITMGVLGGINGLLALLLVIAEKFIANYGSCRITVNGEKIFEIQGGSSLLNSLKTQKIFLPSACGGRGTCAYCKCRVLDNGGTVLPTEAPLLTQDEIKNHVRLACQLKVKKDLAVEIPEELFNIQEFTAVVEKLEDLTSDIKLVRLQLKHPETIQFKPGQYVQLQNNPYEGVKETASRAYSIASPDSDSRVLELIIRLVPEGIVTTWVHQYLKAGDEVRFTGPMGDFALHEGEGEIVMVAGGSGMAPMVSLLNQLEKQKSKRKITYFFGAVKRSELFYEEVMKRFGERLVDFTFVPALSQPDPDDHWSGKTGLITRPLDEYLQTIDTSKVQGYLCGSPGMIRACIGVFSQRGVENDRIYYDPFS